MKTHTDQTIDVLNGLIEICEDGHHGFSTAAEDTKDGDLRTLFHRFAQQRSSFVQELRSFVRQLGGDAEDHGTAPGKLHRGWIDLKAALSSHKAHAVLAECERGEDAAMKAYREALEKLDDPMARELVSRQFAHIQAAHDTVRDLRDNPAYAN